MNEFTEEERRTLEVTVNEMENQVIIEANKQAAENQAFFVKFQVSTVISCSYFQGITTLK